ncbi:hypothetical protein LUQ84_002150 [Hamiltosporidium tvaerminnensis]|nr:hypothetical protein LUQ84_002150 [Hamiltosporidium tvaerminnensis]
MHLSVENEESDLLWKYYCYRNDRRKAIEVLLQRIESVELEKKREYLKICSTVEKSKKIEFMAICCDIQIEAIRRIKNNNLEMNMCGIVGGGVVGGGVVGGNRNNNLEGNMSGFVRGDSLMGGNRNNNLEGNMSGVIGGVVGSDSSMISKGRFNVKTDPCFTNTAFLNFNLLSPQPLFSDVCYFMKYYDLCIVLGYKVEIEKEIIRKVWNEVVKKEDWYKILIYVISKVGVMCSEDVVEALVCNGYVKGDGNLIKKLCDLGLKKEEVLVCMGGCIEKVGCPGIKRMVMMEIEVCGGRGIGWYDRMKQEVREKYGVE